jgi:hypothetical protein
MTLEVELADVWLPAPIHHRVLDTAREDRRDFDAVKTSAL